MNASTPRPTLRYSAAGQKLIGNPKPLQRNQYEEQADVDARAATREAAIKKNAGLKKPADAMQAAAKQPTIDNHDTPRQQPLPGSDEYLDPRAHIRFAKSLLPDRSLEAEEYLYPFIAEENAPFFGNTFMLALYADVVRRHGFYPKVLEAIELMQPAYEIAMDRKNAYFLCMLAELLIAKGEDGPVQAEAIMRDVIGWGPVDEKSENTNYRRLTEAMAVQGPEKAMDALMLLQTFEDRFARDNNLVKSAAVILIDLGRASDAITLFDRYGSKTSHARAVHATAQSALKP